MSRNDIYRMTPADLDVLAAGASNPNAFFAHFFSKPGVRPWQLDYNFTEDGKWQEEMCLASQPFHVIVAGVGAGKTLGVVMSSSYHATLSPGFKFLNVAKESWQSMLMYTAIVEQAEGTLFSKLIVSKPKRPYPFIELGFYIGERYVKSTLEFMSLGEEKDATNIFSWRGDWINIEEAGRIDELSTIVTNLSTRLTGATADGRPFLGRMSLISNPWENPDLWMFFDMAAADTEDGLVMNIDTASNKNVTDAQVKQMLKLIPKDQQERFTTGQRQEGDSNYFSKDSIDRGKSELLTIFIQEGLKKKTQGFEVLSLPHMGAYYVRTPRQPGRMYFEIGDPGTGSAPARNAPCIMVWDVTEAPKICTLAAFYWGNGGGSIMPFLSQFREWLDYYKPTFAGLDSTATQKNMAELVNLEYIFDKGKSVGAVTGFDFSGPKRYGYLVSLRLALEVQMFQWSHAIKGIASQLKAYDPVVDRSPNAKLAQDIVATLAMSAFAVRTQYGIFTPEDSPEDEQNRGKLEVVRRNLGRERRSAVRDRSR